MRCRKCKKRPIPPSNLRSSHYQCSRCRNTTPKARACQQRYAVSEKRRACQQRMNAKRIRVAGEYYASAPTAELARAINAHIKRRRRAFVAIQGSTCAAQQRFPHRKEAQSDPAR